MNPYRLTTLLTSLWIPHTLADSVGTSLAGGSFQARLDVSSQAKIALDVRDMLNALSQNDFNTARNIYIAGANSLQYDADGNPLPYKRSLSSLSTEDDFEREPTFSFHLFGLANGDVSNIDNYRTYADEFVKNALADSTSDTLAAEAAVALNLWMYSAHELWEALEECQTARIYAINPNAAFGFDPESIPRSFDEAMAYWVGSDQQAGTKEGWSLYALAQNTGNMFGTNVNNGESAVNQNLRRLFERGQEFLSLQDTCSDPDDDSTLRSLWTIANRMLSQMTIPLLQMLIRSMTEQDLARVKLYALAVVPQIASCKTSAYRYLKQTLLDRPYDPNTFAEVLTALQGTYECFGVDCEDIGAYEETVVAQCAKRPDNLPMAGYSPSSDVYQHAKIDIDILQIRILSSMEQYTMADYIYSFGKNSFVELEEFRSLKSMATTRDRESVKPFFQYFQDYHNNKNYADVIITQTLQGEGKWAQASAEQRTEIISNTIQYQVMYMYLLTEMQDALGDCESGDYTDNTGSVHSWDEVAAFLIGSLEGIREGGGDVEDGQLLWNLANKRCEQFGTCNSQGYSVINAELENLLYAGKGELTSYDCTNLYHTVRKLQHLVLIPVIQSVIRYAIVNAMLPPNTSEGSLAAGEACALAILPIMMSYEPEAAEVVRENMIYEPGKKPVEDGPEVTGDAFNSIMDEFGLKCEYVGKSEGVDTCAPSGVERRTGGWVVFGVGVVSVIWGLWM